MAHLEVIPHHSNNNVAAVHAIANIAVESEGESRPSRIYLPYRDVHKFRNNGLEAGKIPKMLWKMLHELGYEKQPEYFGTQVTYEGSKPVWHVQVYIFTPKPLRGVYEVEKIHASIASRHYFNTRIYDAARQAYMVVRSRYCQLLDGTEYAHFPQWASGSSYIHVEPVQDEGNIKLNEELKLWQGKYEEAMKTIQKMKHRCPLELETLLDEETEEFNLHSPPHKLATRAPPAYVVSNDVEG
jgi:hypothetical protein